MLVLDLIQPKTSELLKVLATCNTIDEIQEKLTVSRRTLHKRFALLYNLGLADKKKTKSGKVLYFLTMPAYPLQDYEGVLHMVANAPEHYTGYPVEDLTRIDYGTCIRERVYELADKIGGYYMTEIANVERIRHNMLRSDVLQLASLYADVYRRLRGKRKYFLKYSTPEESRNWKSFAKLAKFLEDNKIKTWVDKRMYIEAMFRHFDYTSDNGERSYPFINAIASEQAFKVYKDYCASQKEKFGKVQPQPTDFSEVMHSIYGSAINIYRLYAKGKKKGIMEHVEDAMSYCAEKGMLTPSFVVASSKAKVLESCAGLKEEFRSDKTNRNIFAEVIVPARAEAKQMAYDHLRQQYKHAFDINVFKAMW